MSDLQDSQPKRSTPLAALSLLIGIAALVGFFILNSMMAPPFPKFATNPSAGATNAASSTTNSGSMTNK
jgi:hypothetical protein